MRPHELKAAWNDQIQSHLGLPAPDDRDGCLQDIHWFDGAFGYFPTYTLGALAAAQLFQAAEKEIGTDNLQANLKNGDYASLQGFMTKKIHSQGSFYASSDALIEAATGEPLSTTAFERHIRRRYLS